MTFLRFANPIAPVGYGEAPEYIINGKRAVVLPGGTRTRSGYRGYITKQSVRFIDDGSQSKWHSSGVLAHKIIGGTLMTAAEINRTGQRTGRILFLGSPDGYIETVQRVAERTGNPS
jgi:hypothetical protein